jgi:hypothetical protein
VPSPIEWLNRDLSNRPFWANDLSLDQVEDALDIDRSNIAAIGPVLMEHDPSHNTTGLAVVDQDQTFYMLFRLLVKPPYPEAYDDHVCPNSTLGAHRRTFVGGTEIASICGNMTHDPKYRRWEASEVPVPIRQREGTSRGITWTFQEAPYLTIIRRQPHLDRLRMGGQMELIGHPALLEALIWRMARAAPHEPMPEVANALGIPSIGCIDRSAAHLKKTHVSDGSSGGQGFIYVYPDRLVWIGDKSGGTVRWPQESTEIVDYGRRSLSRVLPWAYAMRYVTLRNTDDNIEWTLDLHKNALDRLLAVSDGRSPPIAG